MFPASKMTPNSMRYFSSVGSFSLKLTYIREHKLGWENAMAAEHNVWVKLRQGERPTAWQVQKFRNVSLGQKHSGAPESSIRRSKTRVQEDITSVLGTRSCTPLSGTHLLCLNGRIPYGLHPHNWTYLPSRTWELFQTAHWECSLAHAKAQTWFGVLCKPGYMCPVILPNSSQLNITDAATRTS